MKMNGFSHLTDTPAEQGCRTWPECGCPLDQCDADRQAHSTVIVALKVLAWTAGVAGVVALGLGVLSATKARAHEAPTGWRFDPECCGNGDCMPVPMTTIRETPNGYQIKQTGEVIPYDSPKVRPSPDGMPYRCSTGGKPEGNTYCIYVPKGGV